jgi:ribonuclease III
VDLSQLVKGLAWKDPKSLLQEYSQRNFQLTPAYVTSGVQGPDHARLFTVQVVIGDRVIAQGQGPSKQTAEREAAHRALNHLIEEGGKHQPT